MDFPGLAEHFVVSDKATDKADLLVEIKFDIDFAGKITNHLEMLLAIT